MEVFSPILSGFFCLFFGLFFCDTEVFYFGVIPICVVQFVYSSTLQSLFCQNKKNLIAYKIKIYS